MNYESRSMAKGGTQIGITEVLVIEITCGYDNRAWEKQLERARVNTREQHTRIVVLGDFEKFW